MNIRGWFPLGLTGLIALQSKGLSRVFSNTTVQKHQSGSFHKSLILIFPSLLQSYFSYCPQAYINIIVHIQYMYILYKLGFPGGAIVKETAFQCRRHKRCGFDSWIRKIPWRRNGNPLQYSCLEIPMNRGDWQSTTHRVTKSWTRLKRLSMHIHKQTKMHTFILYSL